MDNLKIRETIQLYHPMHMLQQFGCRQYIPPLPFCAIYENRRKISNSYLVKYAHVEEMWTNWEGHMLSQERWGSAAANPDDCTVLYMVWYSHISRCFFGPSPHVDVGGVPQQSSIDIDQVFFVLCISFIIVNYHGKLVDANIMTWTYYYKGWRKLMESSIPSLMKVHEIARNIWKFYIRP